MAELLDREIEFDPDSDEDHPLPEGMRLIVTDEAILDERSNADYGVRLKRDNEDDLDIEVWHAKPTYQSSPHTVEVWPLDQKNTPIDVLTPTFDSRDETIIKIVAAALRHLGIIGHD